MRARKAALRVTLLWVSNPPTDNVLCVIIALQRLCFVWRGVNQCFLKYLFGS
jgi:hypothetical protein